MVALAIARAILRAVPDFGFTQGTGPPCFARAFCPGAVSVPTTGRVFHNADLPVAVLPDPRFSTKASAFEAFSMTAALVQAFVFFDGTRGASEWGYASASSIDAFPLLWPRAVVVLGTVFQVAGVAHETFRALAHTTNAFSITTAPTWTYFLFAAYATVANIAFAHTIIARTVSTAFHWASHAQRRGLRRICLNVAVGEARAETQLARARTIVAPAVCTAIFRANLQTAVCASVDFVTQASTLQALAVSGALFGAYCVLAVVARVEALVADALSVGALAFASAVFSIGGSALLFHGHLHAFLHGTFFLGFRSFFLGQLHLGFFLVFLVLGSLGHGSGSLVQGGQVTL